MQEPSKQLKPPATAVVFLSKTTKKVPIPLIDYRPNYVDTKDTINFALIRIKQYYDTHHQPIFFKVGDLVKLRLYRGYKILVVSSKFGPQFIGPFKVLERIGRLIYRLQLPSNIKIYNIVSVAQLEPTIDPSLDKYNRRPPPSSPTIVDNKDE